MKKICYFNSTILIILLVNSFCIAEEAVDLTEPMKQSLVFLEISNSAYDLYQPWKRTPTSKESGFGCAVGPYHVLTTAENVMNATLVQARRYGQNEYISATVETVDYELNLCLLKLDQSTMESPLTPLSFTESFPKNKQLTTYWLSSGNHLTTARSTLDRAEMQNSNVSFAQNLIYFATNVSRPFGDGEVFCDQDKIIGMACWGTDSDSGVIPSETINRFLTHCREESYDGFGTAGFETYALLDPVMRSYLKMPEDLRYGVYISTVYTMGTGSVELKQTDVLLSLDGKTLNPYGRYDHPEYDRISFNHIFAQTPSGEKIPAEVFRDGKKIQLELTSRSIKSDKMLVPYYQYGKQPEYMVLGGFVFQQLSRDYLMLWGNDFSGKVPPNLYTYYRRDSFMPTPQRQDIVILSYVLPIQTNQGYQQLSRIVVDSINGKKIASMKDISAALNETPESGLIEVSFEMDNPIVAIPKDKLILANAQASQLYGIPKMENIKE